MTTSSLNSDSTRPAPAYSRNSPTVPHTGLFARTPRPGHDPPPSSLPALVAIPSDRRQEVRPGMPVLSIIQVRSTPLRGSAPYYIQDAFAKIAVDCYGPLPESEDKITHVVVTQDMFTRYVNLCTVAGTGVR
ncbi:hypothetical protein BGX26_007150 [Mortierella sp. AD094]|nr:hypothetical protein BGX26_007150 [Mortierella sp. AD094]